MRVRLKAQAQKIGLDFYPVHDCSICGYTCGYRFHGESVFYDSGCYCVTYTNLQPRDWQDLAYTYNMNQPENNPKISEKFLEDLNKTWKFRKAVPSREAES